MAKISVDLMGDTAQKVEVTCFTTPQSGVCLTIRTAANVVEIDLPEKTYAMVKERIGRSEVVIEPWPV
jgi:hypothetical protein